MNLIKVSRDEFFKILYAMSIDIITRIDNTIPFDAKNDYVTWWETRNRKVWGKSYAGEYWINQSFRA
jgi:hypothetical protein